MLVTVVQRGVRYARKTVGHSRFPPVTSHVNRMLAGMEVKTASWAFCHQGFFNDDL